jgi:hypothetical protein
MHTDEIERAAGLRVREKRLGAGETEIPGDLSDGDQVAGVVGADGRGEAIHPGLRHLFPAAAGEIEGDTLNEMFAAKFAGEPFGFGLPGAGQDRLVHQVVAENRRARGAGAGDGGPEFLLHRPAPGLGEGVVPRRDVAFVIATKAGEIEVEAGVLGEADQAGEEGERTGIRIRGGLHELPQLQVHAHEVGAEIAHLPEILLHGGPLLLPVIFEQAARIVVVVVEAPGHESSAGGCAYEVRAVGTDANPLQGGARRG